MKQKVDKPGFFKNPKELVPTPKFSKKTGWLLGAGVVFALLLSQITLAGKLAVTGKKLSEIAADKQLLVSENQILENQISEKSSLAYLKKAALEQGFVSAVQNAYFVSLKEYLASNPLSSKF